MDALTTARIIATEQNDAQVVTAEGFTVGQLRQTFNRMLRPGQNWKDAILSICQPEERALVEASITFFVGGPTRFTEREFLSNGATIKVLVVENDGYWRNIGS